MENKAFFTLETEAIAKENSNACLEIIKLVNFDKKYSYLENWFAIRVEDFVKIVKQAGSIKRDPTEKKI